MAEARGTRRATRSGGAKSTGSSRPKTASGTSRPKSTAKSTAKTTAKSPPKGTAKGTAKSTAATTRPRKRAAERAERPKAAEESRAPRSGETSGQTPAAASRLREIATDAAEELAALIGHEAEGVSAVRRGEAGWRVEVDVVEVLRIPDTTSLLATYEMTLDEEGHLVEYRRLRRFRRGWADG
ncbi:MULTISPECIES: gas vesicle protein GvpO [unclassified Streptomyces]|uniref:Gas vesicle protein GvpO n=1 Tax=Streptomyces evansiae TaxID=3075535 RepID=A0ABU2QXG4_9ACTN|nr:MULTISPECIES: gas vesicle protein GvpO [unclassified Streptomyces]MDT0408802.1 gas vesicle protein GvpO [Streptomyces sp. DSM 41979]MYQ57568.1 gas vesicle protein [Streptomyces sp. SID4926]SCD72747.1 Gas vesicle synthesis protein GvpO [Streptomyces sp. DfronAA-171]